MEVRTCKQPKMESALAGSNNGEEGGEAGRRPAEGAEALKKLEGALLLVCRLSTERRPSLKGFGGGAAQQRGVLGGIEVMSCCSSSSNSSGTEHELIVV